MRNETAEDGAPFQTSMGQRGSVVLFTLFVCLATALCVQIVSVVLMCGQQALVEEKRGRELARARDMGIAALRAQALTVWGPRPYLEIDSAGTSTAGRLVEVGGGEGWVLGAEVFQDEALTDLRTSAWLERGRDGVDLPRAALVAGTVHASSERPVPWLVGEDAGGQPGVLGKARVEAVAYVGQVPESPQIGENCRVAELRGTWTLDEGWLGLMDESCRLSPGAFVLVGEERQIVNLPESMPASSMDTPVLVMVCGGADLDARGAGNLYGVVVVDRGSLLLEGTIVHGAVIASGEVDLGLTGQVQLCSSVLHWATDRSLERVRAVPGTLREGTE